MNATRIDCGRSSALPMRCHIVKATPAKPMTMPSTVARRGVSRSRAGATSARMSGFVLAMIAAIPDDMSCSATYNSPR